MKQSDSLKVSGKSSSMSHYLINAHQKLSTQKDQQIWHGQTLTRNSQPKRSMIVNFERQSQQFKDRKAQRSLSDAILLKGIKKRGLSEEKIDLQVGADNLKVSQNKSIKARQSTYHAQALVQKWRNSISGMQLLKKRKSMHVSSSNYLFLKLQQKQKRKSSMVPRQPSTKSIKDSPHKKTPPPLSLSKHPSLKNPKKLYNSIRQYNREQKFWLFHLAQELSLKEVIEEFQKIELNRNVQPSKKLTMRQAYQLKKEIVFEIQKEKSQSIQANIEKLAEMALDQKEKDKFLMIGFFIALRQKLKHEQQQQLLDDQQQSQAHKPSAQTKPQFIYKQQIISDIKQEIKSWKRYKFEDANIINIKILSILALHIIKLESPTFSFEDLELISTTIRLKKKGQTIIDYLSEQDKVVHFQSLIYIIFQFYKNLYYLKLDEEMKIEQYNSLKAYIELYEARDPVNFQNFQDRYKISTTIQNIKPASVGIYPYQDSRIRNEIMFRTLQKELHNQSSDQGESGAIGRKPKIKINKKTLITHMNQEKEQQYLKETQSQSSKDQISRSEFSSQQDSSRMQQSKADVSEVPSHNTMQANSNRKLSLKKQVTPSKKKVSLKMKFDDNNNIMKNTSHDLRLDKNRRGFNNRNSIQKNEQKMKKLKQKEPFVMDEANFRFEFILIKETRLFSGSFNLAPTAINNILKMTISLKDHNMIPLAQLTFTNIRVIPQTQTRSGFQKFMWKVFKKIFVVNLIAEEDPFLMKEYNRDPEHLKNYSEQAPLDSEFRLLEVIHDYLIYWMKKQPFAYNFSGRGLERPLFNPQQINKYMENLEYEHDRKMFQKRYGYLDSRSGRRAGLSPGKTSKIVFSEIRNQFYVDQAVQSETERRERLIRLVKNVMLLVKVNMSDKVEMKFVKMLFFKHIREISIFEQGMFKHTGSSLIHEKIPALRKLKNHTSLNRNRLIYQLQHIFTFPSHSYLNPNSQFDDMMLNKSFHIEQQFQVDLTNEFKFIPSIEIQLVYEVSMRDFEVVQIRQDRLNRQKRKGLVRKKIEKDFIVGLELQQSRQNTDIRHNTVLKRKSLHILTTFKISLCLFLTASFHFTWGTRHLTINKSLQFFAIKPHYALKDIKFTYQIYAISLYKIPLMLDCGTHTFELDDRKYYFYHARKPFLSKLNTLIVLGKTKSQENVKKFGDAEKLLTGGKSGETEVVLMQELHFIEEKLYLRLRKQKMLKFMIEGKSTYFLLQMYQTLQPPAQVLIHSPLDHSYLFIYQLTNLRNPQVKYFLTLDQQLPFEDLAYLKSQIDITKFTLKGQQMQVFEIPVQKINFQNEFFEKKTKNVRKKVISQANYFFQERVLAICNNLKNQNILINVLHKYRVSKREKFKFS